MIAAFLFVFNLLLALWLAGMCALMLLVLTSIALAAWDMWRDKQGRAI